MLLKGSLCLFLRQKEPIFDKMAGHGHGGGCSHEHDHDVPDDQRGDQFSLYLKIDDHRIQCLNESVEGSGKDVFKPWDQRLETDKV